MRLKVYQVFLMCLIIGFLMAHKFGWEIGTVTGIVSFILTWAIANAG